MLEAFSAEALKMRRHKATWFLVWMYPIVFSIIFLIAIGVGLAGVDQKPELQSLENWIEDTIIVWIVPGHAMGRYLISAFVAVVFAGEYGWNTWKLVVPHRSRTSLIAAKYAVVLTLLVTAFIITALISTAGTFAEDAVTRSVIPEGVTVASLAEAHWTYALAAIAPLLVTVAYASLAAVLTRSTIAALVISIVAVTIEQLLFNFAPILSVKFPTAIDILYPVLPGYHMINVSEWIREGVALTARFPDGDVYVQSLTTSAAVVAAWVVALVGATFFAFRRQDIN